MPSTDTYIAKDSAINDEIDKLRLSATAALAGTEGCGGGFLGFLYLRPGQPGRLLGYDDLPASGNGEGPR